MKTSLKVLYLAVLALVRSSVISAKDDYKSSRDGADAVRRRRLNGENPNGHVKVGIRQQNLDFYPLPRKNSIKGNGGPPESGGWNAGGGGGTQSRRKNV